LASDVAAEGINLHFLCHRLIHFDIPWSLMVFQQRNGRIDRYGQERTPQILYLITESRNHDIKGDNRILEVLVRKDEQAEKNIGDPRALMGVYDVEEEEKSTAAAIESAQSAEEFGESLEPKALAFDPLSVLTGDDVRKGQPALSRTADLPSLYASDFASPQPGLAHPRKDN